MEQLERFKDLYRTMSADNLDGLGSVYSKDIRFIDPAHEINGLPELRRYFQVLYENISTISFEFGQVYQTDDSACLTWLMAFSHPRIAGNRKIRVPGISQLTFNTDGKVVFHRDYFDLGAMLYEHLPLIGSILKTIKKRLGA